jgi:hypothetical protein
MGPKTPTLLVAAVVLIAAGVAVASHQVVGPSPGLAVDGPVVAQSSTSPATTTAPGASTTDGTPGTSSTTGPSTGTPGPTTPSTTPTATATTGASTTAAGALSIDQVVSITRTVEAGAGTVNVFTVPAGQQLVVTDVLITNPGVAPACGAAIGPGGGTSGPTGGESGTGALCVPAQSSLNLGLTTGMEFDAGQSVLLANAIAPATTGGLLHFHLRGFLMSPNGA